VPSESPAAGGPGGPSGGPASGRLPWPAVFYIAAFAALLASFPARLSRNSDLLMHLAAGRSVLSGSWGAGAAGQPAAPGQTWLFDVACYGLYEGLGGAGLVLAKVLLVVGLALLLLRLSRADSGWQVPTACTALALLAMGLHLQVRPGVVSYLFLALTLWWLGEGEREGDRDAAGPAPRLPPLLPPWRLWVLFVIWANADGGFVLGLAVVALVWLGRDLDGPAARLPALRRRAVALGLLLAGCLLNPAHVHALVSAAASLAPGQAPSPFQGEHFRGFGLTPAGLAYYPLLAAGLFSFLLNRPRWRWQRFLPWSALALAAAVQANAVPFFAVVAGPVLAWNLHEIVTRAASRGAREAGRGVRPLPAPPVRALLTACFLVPAECALLVCAWPGWLGPPPFEPRRWGLDLPPSLERGALATRRLYRQRRLRPDGQGLHLSLQTAHAFAWLCPEENGLWDGRLRDALLGRSAGGEDWTGRMRAAGVDHVIVSDPNPQNVLTALAGLLNNPEQWPLLHLEGDLVVFGWRDPARRQGADDPFQDWELNLNRLAFRPEKTRRAPRAPPGRPPQPRQWWDAFWKPAPPRSLDGDEAKMALLCAEALRRAAPYRRVRPWDLAQSAALVGTLASWRWPAVVVEADLGLVLARPEKLQAGAQEGKFSARGEVAFICQRLWAQTQDSSPPALLYLTLRAARRAVADNPDDARAHLALGECYLRLLRDTRERSWARREPRLSQLRLTQASAALNQAVALQPHLAQAHVSLAEVYHRLGYLDLALGHLRQAAGPKAGAGAGGLAEAVQKGEQAYAAQAGKLRMVDRALLARKHGLGGKARDLLLELDISAFGREGVALELELLMRTGRAGDVLKWTADSPADARASLGPGLYHWLRAQGLAAGGDYRAAQQECEQLMALARGGQAVPPREEIALLLGEAILDERPGRAAWTELRRALMGRLDVIGQMTGIVRGMQEEASASALRGLLALEEGNADEAEVAFRLALDVWRGNAARSPGGGIDFRARPLAEACLGWLEDAAEGPAPGRPGKEGK
jgi:tetratricopeptide (TPR) repeat protein